MIDSLLIEIIDQSEFFDCFKLRLVCHEWNQMVMHRFQKLENCVASLFLLCQMGYKNPWNFHVGFRTCKNFDHCESLYIVHHGWVDFEKKCDNHREFNYCDTQFIKGSLYIVGKGANNLYRFDGKKLIKDRDVAFNMTETEKTLIISRDEFWNIQFNNDGSMIVLKQKGQQLLIKDIINGSDPPQPARNQIYSNNTIVFENYDNDMDSIIINYILLDQKKRYFFNMGETHCNIIAWNDKMMLFETDKHLIKFYPSNETDYAFLVIKIKPTRQGLFMFHVIDINDENKLYTPEPHPKIRDFEWLEDDISMRDSINFDKDDLDVITIE